jgi:DNA-binding XRE family transcriptional regulator
MTTPVLLLTDRPAFEHAWRAAFGRRGLAVRAIAADALGAAIRRGSVLLLDAACEAFDEDELLAHVGLSRALGATCAVVLPDDSRFAGIEDLLDDLCPGLLARGAQDIERVAATVARRADAERSKRFEYLAVSPRANELLAILADGSAALFPRPASETDDGSEVSSIALSDGAEEATLTLVSGNEFTLRAAATNAGAATARPSVSPTNGSHELIPIDGIRLGRRLRALRMAAGLTQAELARRTGIHRPNIARVEAGRHTPSLDTLARLASAIGVPTTSVLAEE